MCHKNNGRQVGKGEGSLNDSAGWGRIDPKQPGYPPEPWDLLLHGQEFGVHTLLFPLHQLHIRQQPGDTVLAYFYVLILQSGHLRVRAYKSLKWHSGSGEGLVNTGKQRGVGAETDEGTGYVYFQASLAAPSRYCSQPHSLQGSLRTGRGCTQGW